MKRDEAKGGGATARLMRGPNVAAPVLGDKLTIDRTSMTSKGGMRALAAAAVLIASIATAGAGAVPAHARELSMVQSASVPSCGVPPGDVLTAGSCWRSGLNGQSAATLIMQLDGNLVVYDETGRARWASNTFGSDNYAIMQQDGNFVVYSSNGTPLWASGTFGEGNVVIPQDDGNVVIYDSNHNPLWATGTQH
ncbi:hypothetical protein AB0G73_10850 [Streptomyces sp. NPDC020719]|uniref:hypothetical protein n=1 Tax=Streptomyces sp. NPDC020719 TaxID=3154896 RepID=UPI0033CF3551